MNAAELFDLWFGSRADRVRAEYSRIQQLQATGRILSGSREQVAQDLAAFDDQSNLDLDACREDATQLAAALEDQKTRLRKLAAGRDRIDAQLCSPGTRLSIQFKSVLTLGQSPSADALESKRRQLRKEIDHLETAIREQDLALAEVKRRLKQAGRSRESLAFAANKVRESQAQVEQERIKTHCRIDEYIRTVAQASRLHVLRAKQRSAKGRNVFFGKVYELRRVLQQLACLNNRPPLQIPGAQTMKFGVVDIVRPIREAFETELADVAGRLPMAGRGLAHKKVGSGSNTRWKQVTVEFSGHVNVCCTIETDRFANGAMAAAAVKGAQRAFAEGLAATRKEYAQQLADQLEEQADKLTAELRQALEAGLVLPTPVHIDGETHKTARIGH